MAPMLKQHWRRRLVPGLTDARAGLASSLSRPAAGGVKVSVPEAAQRKIGMTFFYGQTQLTAAQNELTKCWAAKDPKSPDTIKQAYHALIMLSAGIAEALEDFSERLPPAK